MAESLRRLAETGTSARPLPGNRRVNVAGWIALGSILLVVGGGGWLMRERVVEFWPPTAWLYAAIGAPVEVPGEGLELSDIMSKREVEDGVPLLIVEGKIRNVSDEVQEIPVVRASLLDDSSREVHQWIVPVTEYRLLPGEIVEFTTRVENPSTEARELTLTFAVPE